MNRASFVAPHSSWIANIRGFTFRQKLRACPCIQGCRGMAQNPIGPVYFRKELLTILGGRAGLRVLADAPAFRAVHLHNSRPNE